MLTVECGGCAPPVVIKEGEVTLVFPRSAVLRFYKENPTWKEKGLRLGQAFFNWMELDKVKTPENKAFCDKLFNVTSDVAARMIISRTDWEQ